MTTTHGRGQSCGSEEIRYCKTTLAKTSERATGPLPGSGGSSANPRSEVSVKPGLPHIVRASHRILRQHQARTPSAARFARTSASRNALGPAITLETWLHLTSPSAWKPYATPRTAARDGKVNHLTSWSGRPLSTRRNHSPHFLSIAARDSVLPILSWAGGKTLASGATIDIEPNASPDAYKRGVEKAGPVETYMPADLHTQTLAKSGSTLGCTCSLALELPFEGSAANNNPYRAPNKPAEEAGYSTLDVPRSPREVPRKGRRERWVCQFLCVNGRGHSIDLVG